MKPKIHRTELKKSSILLILKYPPNLNHNALNTQRNVAAADVLNSSNEKKLSADSPFTGTPVLHPIPTIDASLAITHSKQKVKASQCLKPII